MKIVFFINKKNGFARSLIGYMEEYFPQHEFIFYIIDRRYEEKLPEQENVNRILSYKEFLTNKELRRNILKCDKILVSGVFTMHIILSFFSKKVLRKTYLQFWGGDFYCFRNKTKKNRVMKIFMDHCVKNCAAVITLVASEQEEFLKYFPYEGIKFYAVPVPASPEEKLLQQKYRKLAMEFPATECRRIIIGNSATPENQHLQLFEMIRHLSGEKIEIYCPLSYGIREYRDEVIAKGTELFADSFHPITEYMDYEEYMKLLCTCSVGLYNLNRQQGMGNISMLINMGKKVYIRSDISLWSYYQSYGYKMNDTLSISRQTIQEIFSWTTEDQVNNHAAYDYRNRQMKLIWTDIIES